MKNYKFLLAFSWIGSLLFFLAAMVFGFLTTNYSHIGQFISELGADNAPYNHLMNYLGIIPFGLSIILFSIGGFKVSIGKRLTKSAFVLLLIVGVLFVIAGFFNCDQGCSFEDMSQKSIIHNMSAFSAFILSVAVQFLVGINSFFKQKNKYYLYSFFAALLGMILFYIIGKAGIYSDYRGLYQRLFLLNFLIWLVVTGQNLIQQNYSSKTQVKQ